MTEPLAPRERLLAELRRELGPLGWRQRRRALEEAHDHLLSALEDELAEGATAEDAERRAVARFGDPRLIAAKLCLARPRTRRRLLPMFVAATSATAFFAVAAGPLGRELEPQPAAAATLPGLSMVRCAQAFDGAANAAGRARLARDRVLNVQIFLTSMPSCVIKFQLTHERVLTAESPWKAGSADDWQYSTREHGRVAGRNARWSGGRLRAIGPGAGLVIRSGPPPTVRECAVAWNAHLPALALSLPAGPALVRPLTSSLHISLWDRTSSTSMSGPGCTIWVLGARDRTKMFFAPWDEGRALSWRAPLGANGLLGNAGPNADLAADGRLLLR